MGEYDIRQKVAEVNTETAIVERMIQNSERRRALEEVERLEAEERRILAEIAEIDVIRAHCYRKLGELAYAEAQHRQRPNDPQP